MGWKEYYYECNPLSLKLEEEVYGEVVDFLREKFGENFENNKRQVLVLGGFHPFNGTPEGFERICKKISQNPNDVLVFLDMNRIPLENIRRGAALGLQGRLEEMPLKGIDFLFLDFTFNFMEEEQIRQFAARAEETINKDGLIWASVEEGWGKNLIWARGWLKKRLNRVPFYSHKPEKIAEMMKSCFKLVVDVGYEIRKGDFCRLLVFGKRGGRFDKFPRPWYADLYRE